MSVYRAHRPRRVKLPRAGASSVTATLPAIAAAAAILPGLGAHTAPVPVISSPDTSAAMPVIRAGTFRQAVTARTSSDAAMATYRVRPGDSISAVAQRRCGQARDWTGIFAASRKRHLTGPDANIIQIGQELAVDCRYLPSQLKYAQAPVLAVRTTSTTTSSAAPVKWHHRLYHAIRRAWHAVTGSGTYSFAGLEALWVSAGGPSWAEAAAAAVAECESGGRVTAYNPSGATGLWQILGAVVPGNLYDPYVNALNAVSKFRASGSTWAQWVCKP
jgi:hypothetical protein